MDLIQGTFTLALGNGVGPYLRAGNPLTITEGQGHGIKASLEGSRCSLAILEQHAVEKDDFLAIMKAATNLLWGIHRHLVIFALPDDDAPPAIQEDFAVWMRGTNNPIMLRPKKLSDKVIARSSLFSRFKRV